MTEKKKAEYDPNPPESFPPDHVRHCPPHYPMAIVCYRKT